MFMGDTSRLIGAVFINSDFDLAQSDALSATMASSPQVLTRGRREPEVYKVYNHFR